MFRHHFQYPRSLRIVFDMRQVDLARPFALAFRLFFVLILAQQDSFRLVQSSCFSFDVDSRRVFFLAAYLRDVES